MDTTEFNQLEKKIEDLYDYETRKLFNFIIEKGQSVFSEDSPLRNFKDTDLIERLIKYFESLEEYEKCVQLSRIKEKVKS